MAGNPPDVPLRGLVVALDGPASSGKSSVGTAAAKALGYRFCDTGLLYRAMTWLALRRGVTPDQVEALVALVPGVQLLDVGDGRLAHVAVDGVDETAEVHSPEVDNAVSAFSRVAELRDALLHRQRAIAADGRIIMAGRDIGTIVLPDADLKLFLDASVEERARRRAAERGFEPGSPDADEVEVELRRRDELDSSRTVAPLRAPEHAVVIKTDGNAFETTVGLVVDAIRAAEARSAAPKPANETADPPATPATGAARAAASEPRPRRSTRPPAKPTRIRDRIGWFTGISGFVLRTLARTVLRLHVEGDPGTVAREGAIIVAANHASSADPVLVGAFLNKRLGRSVNWLGKRELVEMPIVGRFLRMVPIHPVDREAADLDAFRTAMRILQSGNILAVFPEGTRSRDGALQPVREGVGVLALHSGAVVLPVAIVDSDLAWPKGHLLPRFGRRVAVHWGQPFRVQDELPDLASMPRKQANTAATRLVMTRIAELLPPRQRGVYADAVGPRDAAAGPAGSAAADDPSPSESSADEVGARR
jgi:cytidylate kinase